MANEQYTSGPTRSLPGRRRTPEKGARCDEHDHRLAVVKIQGETDSFGAEYFYLCQECLTEWDAPKDPVEEECEWCKSIAVLKPIRDLGEGMCGRVYYVCDKCAAKNIADNLDE